MSIFSYMNVFDCLGEYMEEFTEWIWLGLGIAGVIAWFGIGANISLQDERDRKQREEWERRAEEQKEERRKNDIRNAYKVTTVREINPREE